MMTSHQNGGVQYGTADLREAGFMSSGALSAKLGLHSAITASFIVNELGILPRTRGGTGSGYQWAPEQLSEIRRAMIVRLVAQEFGGDVACGALTMLDQSK